MQKDSPNAVGDCWSLIRKARATCSARTFRCREPLAKRLIHSHTSGTVREIDSTNQVVTSSSGRATLAAWLIILACVAFLVVRNARSNGNDDDSLTRDVRMKLLAQEAIGFGSLPPALAQGINQRMPELIRLLEHEARTPEEKLKVAIVAGYLQPENALQRLDTVSISGNSSTIADDVATVRTIYTEGAGALQPADRDRLSQRYGYFGNVALASGVPGDDASAKKSVEAASRRTLVLMLMTVPAFLGLFVLSITMLVIAIVYWKKGKIRSHYTPAATADTAYVEAFALYLVFFIAIGFAARAIGLANLNWNWIAWLIIPAAILWLKTRSTAPNDWRMAIGWYSARGFLRESAAGIAGYFAGLPLVAIGLGVSFVLIQVTGAAPRGPIIRYLHGNMLALYAIACVFAPVLEETMFRGVLFHHLRARWSWPASAVLVAFLFAAIHPQGWAAIPILGAIAIVLATLREWRGSIIAPMAAHAFNNFIVITIALVFLR
jgi:membrane protease YdiL (CAAX protease family)